MKLKCKYINTFILYTQIQPTKLKITIKKKEFY